MPGRPTVRDETTSSRSITGSPRRPSWDLSPFPFGIVPVNRFRNGTGRSGKSLPGSSGAADSSRPPDFEHLRLAFTGLAAFHQRLAGEQVEAVSTGLRQRHEEIIRLIRGGFHTLEIAINRQNERWSFRTADLRSRGLRWLGTWPRCCSSRSAGRRAR